ncbi:MAG: formylglycine-generating enzyme family protein, partial [Planctomycetaceae bacterium]
WAGGRLPTEAEWEYSCRAGSDQDYCFGDHPSLLHKHAWYDLNSVYCTHPVGEKLGNAWGLHDMHGNVWEWCQDWYGAYAAEPSRDPQGPPEGDSRVLRGGSWLNSSDDCSAWYRIYYTPEYRYSRIGFRLARTLPFDS